MKDFVDYDTAILLQEIGFNEPCLSFYDESKVVQPSIQEVGTLVDMRITQEERQQERELWKDYDLDDDVFIDYLPSLPLKDTLRPTWGQVKNWLWEKHEIEIGQRRVQGHDLWYGVWERFYLSVDTINSYPSPITANREATIKAIQHLFEQQNKN